MTRLEMAQALRAHDNYIILTHRRPDGDTLGSAAGLCLGLRALGKNAWVLKNRQLTPKLAPFTEGLVTDTCPEHATVLSVDIASLGLLSFDAAELGLGDQIALAIDHHGSNDLNAPKLVEADRAACGEIILELLELLGVSSRRSWRTHSILPSRPTPAAPNTPIRPPTPTRRRQSSSMRARTRTPLTRHSSTRRALQGSDWMRS